jgi:hypothetical protein
MRVSEYFGLGRNQPTLDFVDVDVVGDTRVFVDLSHGCPVCWSTDFHLGITGVPLVIGKG